MKTMRGWRLMGSLGLGMALATVTGCQTWTGGMTLPSGHYLDHPPQYITPSPTFPLQRELATQEAQTAGEGEALGGPAVLPAPVAPPPGGQLPPPVPAPIPAGPRQ